MSRIIFPLSSSEALVCLHLTIEKSVVETRPHSCVTCQARLVQPGEEVAEGAGLSLGREELIRATKSMMLISQNRSLLYASIQ